MVHSNVVIRVFCVDGPCRGLQYINLVTGRIIAEAKAGTPSYIYRVSDHRTQDTDFGPSRVAHFDHAETTTRWLTST